MAAIHRQAPRLTIHASPPRPPPQDPLIRVASPFFPPFFPAVALRRVNCERRTVSTMFSVSLIVGISEEERKICRRDWSEGDLSKLPADRRLRTVQDLIEYCAASGNIRAGTDENA